MDSHLYSSSNPALSSCTMITTGLLIDVPPFSSSARVTVGESALVDVFFGDEHPTATIIMIDKTWIVFIHFALQENKGQRLRDKLHTVFIREYLHAAFRSSTPD